MNYICRAADICDEMKRGFAALALIVDSLSDLPQTDGIRYVTDKLIATADQLGDILDNALAEERENKIEIHQSNHIKGKATESRTDGVQAAIIAK